MHKPTKEKIGDAERIDMNDLTEMSTDILDVRIKKFEADIKNVTRREDWDYYFDLLCWKAQLKKMLM
ncbi:hypothetical protein HYY72_05310 [Candidatus Woesearchaeota archaeon]|nr:hypothetical protein [Candidatus Woesearchaeota archaeon]